MWSEKCMNMYMNVAAPTPPNPHCHFCGSVKDPSAKTSEEPDLNWIWVGYAGYKPPTIWDAHPSIVSQWSGAQPRWSQLPSSSSEVGGNHMGLIFNIQPADYEFSCLTVFVGVSLIFVGSKNTNLWASHILSSTLLFFPTFLCQTLQFWWFSHILEHKSSKKRCFAGAWFQVSTHLFWPLPKCVCVYIHILFYIRVMVT